MQLRSATQGATLTDMDSEHEKPGINICDLPDELLHTLCACTASTRELKALRLTCRELYDRVERIFVKRQFSEVKINLSRASLAYLDRIAQSGKYSGKVEALVIEPRYPDKLPAPFVLNAEPRIDEDWETDCKTGQDADMLAKTLKALVGLMRVEIQPWAGEAAHTSPRDNGRWSGRTLIQAPSWTASFVQPMTGPCWITPMSHAFSVVLRVLEMTHLPNLRELRAGGVPHGAQRNAVDDLVLKLTTPPSNKMIITLAQLQNLHLSVELRARTSGSLCETRLASLLQWTCGLNTLKLEFWGFLTDFLSATLAEVYLPQLRNVHFAAVRKISCKELRAFVQRHKETLSTMTLVNISFDDDDLATVFPTIFENLHLHTLRVQQIVSRRVGLVVFGANIEIICYQCYRDLEAAWKFEDGPSCKHATLIAHGEYEVLQTLGGRMSEVELLPWPLSHGFIIEEWRGTRKAQNSSRQ